MIGTYEGHYKFIGKNLPKSVKELRTNFKIEITDFTDGKFLGTVKDDENTGGMPGTGTISGEFSDNKISFIKQMPNAGILMPGGKIRMLKQKHPPIFYNGINEIDDSFSGSWEMKVRFKIFGLIPVYLGKSTGIWDMKKCKSDKKIPPLNITNEIIKIIIELRKEIKDDAEIGYSGFSDIQELQKEIDKDILMLKEGKREIIDKYKVLFLPTTDLQDLSIINHWDDRFIILAESYDKLFAELNK